MLLFLLAAAIYLCLLSVYDIRTKTIPGWAPCVFGSSMGILHLILSDMTLLQFFTGLIPGMILLFLSFAFRSSLGAGDGLVVLSCGAAIGLEREFTALTASLVICAVCCILLLILKRVRRTDSLAFLPFLAFSHLVMLIAEVIL